MGLTPKEKKLLAQLQDKAEQPDRPEVGNRSLSISIDLGDEAQVERAQKLGLLDGFDDDADDGDDGDDDDDDDAADTPPRRRGFFPES